MTRFTAHNTDYQYNNSELAILNEKFEQIMADNYDPDDLASGYYDSIEYKSWQDGVAEKLLADFQ